MAKIIFKDTRIINEGKTLEGDLLVENGKIIKIGGVIDVSGAEEIDGSGKCLMPGVIDDQVHFREPGLTHKADISTESRAAAAGGVTSFMEMPNTKPAALTQELLEEKYKIGRAVSPVNYSFFMGASNDNLEEVLKTNAENVCGVKIFMGSSTGNMLVDEEEVLTKLFANVPMLIATHCEDEARVRARTEMAIAEFGEDIPMDRHPWIRDEEACYLSSSKAKALAEKYNTRLHILHISTQEELALFTNEIPLEEKRITAEVCVHHLWFDATQYETLGSRIKCNPAIKGPEHKAKLFEALLDNRLDIIATDHAPHTLEEKQNKYLKSPSGLPLVSHSLQAMLDFHAQGIISKERIVEKMAHAPAVCFNIRDRGFIREGYHADLVLFEEKDHEVKSEELLYKCGWSPFEGHHFTHSIYATYVNGINVFQEGKLSGQQAGERLLFNLA